MTMNIFAPRLAISIIALLLFSNASAAGGGAAGKCAEGYYAGRESGAQRYAKDEYIWAVTREFARRFCMPEKFIDDTLKGAEAMAYQFKAGGVPWCEMVGNEERCTAGRSHWLEVYVKSTVNIPRYDPYVKFYIRSTLTSAESLRNVGIQTFHKKVAARRRGEITEPPGRQHPFRGFTPDAEGKETSFHYLALLTSTRYAERAASLSVQYYEAEKFEGIDLIILDSPAAGNLVGPRLPESELGFVIGVTREVENSAELIYPSGFLHVIVMPNRIISMMHDIDRKAGLGLENAVRAKLND